MIRRGSLLSRLLALALLVAALGVAWVGVLRPALDGWSASQARIADAVEARDRFARLAGEREAAEQELAAARAAVAEAGLYLTATSETLAAAEMREKLNEVVGRYGGELRSVRVTPEGAATAEGRSIGMRVAMRGGFESLFATLLAVESGAPYYFVESAELKARRVRRRRNAQNEDPEDVLLELRFDVNALMRLEGEP